MLIAFGKDDSVTTRLLGAFREGLAALGWSEGRNLRIDIRFGAGAEDAPERVAEALGLGPDLLVVHAPGLDAARAATRTVPIIFVGGPDPVGAGLVQSLAHPGGNLTGLPSSQPELGPKWLQLLKEIAPNVRRVAVLSGRQSWRDGIAAAGKSLAVEVTAPSIRLPADIEAAVTALADRSDGGFVVADDVTILTHRALIIELARRYRLPQVAGNRGFVEGGGLLYYGSDLADLYRRSAVYVDRILKGAKPGDLPVQQPTAFELVINQATARALGIAVPPALLARATEVIE